MRMGFSFNLNQSCGEARLGELDTPHGKVNTPAFMPVATQATVKTLTPEEVNDSGAEMILSNAYHLYLRPGVGTVQKLGGLHQFMNWNGPMLTDSGGFQIFSLGYGSVADEIKGRNLNNKINKSLLKISEEGALFKSYIDGTKRVCFIIASGRNLEEASVNMKNIKSTVKIKTTGDE